MKEFSESKGMTGDVDMQVTERTDAAHGAVRKCRVRGITRLEKADE
jgi:hypothetical protein